MESKKRCIDYPEDGIELGQGWDSITGTRKDAFGMIFVQAEAPGQDKREKYEKVTDRHSLMESLQISAEFQYKAVAGAEAGAKASWAQTIETNSTSESFVGTATVENGAIWTAPAPPEHVEEIASQYRDGKTPKEVSDALGIDRKTYGKKFGVEHTTDITKGIEKGSEFVCLNAEARKLAEDNVEKFYRLYGDSFVSAIYSGAELSTVMCFNEVKKTKRSEIDASVQAAGWGCSGEVKFTAKTKEYSERGEFTFKFYQAGGKGDKMPTSMDEVLGKIGELPKLAADDPRCFRIGLQRFDSLPNWPYEPEESVTTPYRAMLRQYFHYQTLSDDITHILRNPGDYLLGRGVANQSLKDMQDEITRGMQAIKELLPEYSSKDAKYELPEAAQKPDYAFRIAMPLPRGYIDDPIPLENIEAPALRNRIGEFWVKTVNDHRREIDDPSFLDNKTMDEYISKINVNVPVFQYHGDDPRRLFYSTDPNASNPGYGGGLKGPGKIAFYAVEENTPNAVPVYQYHGDKPLRHFYSTDPNASNPGYGGGLKGPHTTAFYAVEENTPNAVPVHQYHGKDSLRHFYSTDPNASNPGYGGGLKGPDKIAFYAFPVLHNN